MVEERWHDFAKEKPSEDMEGRNFIVSNGHYEKIATWCGYWENEPFMGDRLCDEVVRWKFYFTPEEEKANEATHTEPKPMKCDELKQVEYPIEWGLYYDKAEVDEAIAELKNKLMPCLNGDCILTCEVVEKYGKENAELKQKLAEKDKEIESLKASAYAESVDAGMRERRLRRALWLLKSRYFWILMVYASDLAKVANPSIIHKSNFLENPTPRCMEEYQHESELYDNTRIKCLKKAEEYGNA